MSLKVKMISDYGWGLFRDDVQIVPVPPKFFGSKRQALQQLKLLDDLQKEK